MIIVSCIILYYVYILIDCILIILHQSELIKYTNTAGELDVL